VKYFSGFSLQKEASLFTNFLIHTDTTVAGFSYGAQLALEYAYASTERIDRLILLSPAYFQTQKPSFIRAQLRYFEADKDAYIAQFLKNVSYPSTFDLSTYLNIGSVKDLEALLTYTWETEKIESLLARGITIEVIMGTEDKIVNTLEAQKFFSKTTNYILKDTGHSLHHKTFDKIEATENK
jgi:pimeloyl-ACP methyl ester carboxylesterase